MQPLKYFYLFGLLVGLTSAKDLRERRCDETVCSLANTNPRTLFEENDFLDTSDEIVELVGVGSPTEEEWSAILNDFGKNIVPEYLAERNYTVEANQTGTFNNSDGVQGGWSARSFIKYHVNETNANVSMISGDTFLVNGNTWSTVSYTRSLYTKSDGEVYWDTLRETWTFIPGANGSHILTGNASSYANGKYEQTSISTGEFFIMSSELSNVTNRLTVTFSQTKGNETYGKERNFLTGNSNFTSIPLNTTRQLRLGDPEMKIPLPNIIQGLVRSNANTNGTYNFTGNYTVGKEGDYNTDSTGAGFSPKGPFSTSSGLQGYYSVAQNLFPQQIHQISTHGPFKNTAPLFLYVNAYDLTDALSIKPN